MLIIIPISRADKHLAESVVRSFVLFPPGNGHDLLVVGSPNVRDEAIQLWSDIRYLFNKESYRIFDQDTHMGWPTACNTYFQETCWHLAAKGHKGGWFWFELDCTPIKPNWLTTIEAEYNQQPDLVFMGSRQNTYRGRNGELLSKEEAGEHMAAPGVYPNDIADRVVTLGGLRDTHIPWWNFIQWSVLPSLHDTKLIQQNYRTTNYRIGGLTNESGQRVYLNGKIREGFFIGDIECDSDNNWAWGVNYNNRINSEAVLVHGCKDGSLLKILENPKGEPDKILASDKPMEPILYDPETGKTKKPIPKSYRKKYKKSEGLTYAG